MDRGEIWFVDIDPTEGRELQGGRPCLIISTRRFNQLGTPLVCPITIGGNLARHAGWAVSLSGAGTQTQGVIVANQLRVLDIAARRGRRIEKAPDFIIDEVLARVATIIE